LIVLTIILQVGAGIHLQFSHFVAKDYRLQKTPTESGSIFGIIF